VRGTLRNQPLGGDRVLDNCKFLEGFFLISSGMPVYMGIEGLVTMLAEAVARVSNVLEGMKCCLVFV
jgi:hypothetical protein